MTHWLIHIKLTISTSVNHWYSLFRPRWQRMPTSHVFYHRFSSYLPIQTKAPSSGPPHTGTPTSSASLSASTRRTRTTSLRCANRSPTPGTRSVLGHWSFYSQRDVLAINIEMKFSTLSSEHWAQLSTVDFFYKAYYVGKPTHRVLKSVWRPLWKSVNMRTGQIFLKIFILFENW